MATRHNLLTDSSFRTLSPWEPVGDSGISRHTSNSVQGESSLRIRVGTQPDTGVRSVARIPIMPLAPYAASVYALVPSVPSSPGSVLLTVQLVWRNASGTVVATSSSPARTIRVTDGWLRLSLVATAPAAATTVQFQVLSADGSPAVAQYFAVDAALVEQSTFVGGWVDNTSSENKTTVLNKALSKPTAHPVEGLPLRADVLIDDLVLNTIDEDDTLWVCTDIDGWWGGSAPEFPSVPRGTDDGDFDMSGRYDSRIITIKGTFFPSDIQYLQRARDRLVSATNLVRRGAWFRTNENPTKAAFVRLSAKVLTETVNARGKTEFSISLKAADPIRYGWNDNDNDGFTTITIPEGSTRSLVVNNQGTAAVNGTIIMTGPMGNGSTISNVRTGESLRLLRALRGANLVASVSSMSVSRGVATLALTDPPDLEIGDRIVVLGLGFPYDTLTDPVTVTSVSTGWPPFLVSYAVESTDRQPVSAPKAGAVRLFENDVLSIDTYEKSVTFNGVSVGNRSRIDTLVDWIQFMPGDNELVLFDTFSQLYLTKRGWTTARRGTVQTSEAHYLSVNDQVIVNIPDTVSLATKSLTSNVVTLNTDTPHGFVAGEKIDVITTEVSNVTDKAVSGNVATLTTDVAGQFSVGDQVTVSLPSSATISAKSATSSEVTLTTATPHKFSNGDLITVALPTTAKAVTRARKNNVATMTTEATHYFSVGDRVGITMPSTATITTKTLTNTNVTLTTSSAHGFAVGSIISVVFPTSATLTGSRNTSGGNALSATLSTSATHGFDVGDRVQVSIGITATRPVTTRAASASTVTLTTATHNFGVGEMITVSGMGARYDGTYPISAVTSTTITYAKSGSVVSSGAAASGSSVTNVTIRDGYNGEKIIDAVTSSTFTFFVGSAALYASSGTGGSGATLTNKTNQAISGTQTVTAVGSSTQLTFGRSD